MALLVKAQQKAPLTKVYSLVITPFVYAYRISRKVKIKMVFHCMCISHSMIYEAIQISEI